MTLKLTFLSFIFILSGKLYSQELVISFNAGSGQVETKSYKKNALFTNALIGYEKLIGYNVKVTGFIGISNSQFDNIDNLYSQIHNFKTSISLTLLAKKIIAIKSSEKYIWTGFGFVQYFTFVDKKEIYPVAGGKTTKTINPQGFNIALLPEIGYNQKITPKASLSLSLQAQTDFFAKAKEDINKTNYQRLLFAITLNKKISPK